MDRSYLIRYGLMGQLGRFSSDSSRYDRGQIVVIRSYRGTELGEVLLELSDPDPESDPGLVLRAAGSDDLECARQADLDRPRRYSACQRVVQEGDRPLEVVEVEPLLEERRTVLRYFGPHRLDAAGLVAAFRSACELDVLLEPVGLDVPGQASQDPAALESGGGCGACGDGGGCGSGGCGTASESPHEGCSSCGIKRLMARRRT